MSDETSNKQQSAVEGRKRRLPRGLPEPLEAVVFALQERVAWPLQDRISMLGPGSKQNALVGGAAAVFLAGVAIVFALSSGSGGADPATTVVEAAVPQASVAATPAPTEPAAKRDVPPRETLHGATPVFSSPSPASEGGEKTAASKAAAAEATASATTGSTGSSAAGSNEASAGDASAAASDAGGEEPTEASTSPSPSNAKISSDPSKPAESAAADPATAARAAVLDGPPAGPAALEVAREFAQGFVVYETGGEASAFKSAFAASATPELKRALLQRPPKQPAGVKVPRAKVLNVVAGPSQGNVYKVSVALLRVGVTSELRLEMEKIKPTGKTAANDGKRVEWRVTNVLG